MKFLATLALATLATAAAAQPIENKFLVVLKDSANQESFTASLERSIERENAREGNSIEHKLESNFAISSFKGYSGTFSKSFVDRLAKSDAVAYIEQDQVMHAFGKQANPPSWGLARVGSRTRGATEYTFPDSAGAGASIFIMDTGLRATHVDFGGRARMGWKAQDAWPNTDDNGHGTHCAGTAAGSIHGVAKKASVIGVKVLGPQGSGATSDIIKGINWVVQQKKALGKTVVVNMSIGGGKSLATNSAVASAVRAGVVFVTAAGNQAQDACNVSPASEPSAITVGSTDELDRVAPTSNQGKCVDLFAPGVKITSTWHTGDQATNTLSGSSMAAAHVAGAAALAISSAAALGQSNSTPASIISALNAKATANVLSGVSTAPNKLLFVN